MVDQVYRYKIERRGNEVKCYIDGEEKCSLTYPGCKCGRVYIWSASKYPRLMSSLNLEGTVDQAWLDDSLRREVSKAVKDLFEECQ